MKTEIKNQNMAYKFRPTFAQWLTDYRGLSVETDDIAVTRDTIENFAAAGGDNIATVVNRSVLYGEVEAFPPESGLDGMKVVWIERAWKQIYILDTGDFRLLFVD